MKKKELQDRVQRLERENASLGGSAMEWQERAEATRDTLDALKSASAKLAKDHSLALEELHKQRHENKRLQNLVISLNAPRMQEECELQEQLRMTKESYAQLVETLRAVKKIVQAV